MPAPELNPIFRPVPAAESFAVPRPYSLAATLGSLVFLMRHQPQEADDLRALSGFVRAMLAGDDLELEARPDRMRVQRELLPLEAPGAGILNEQMLVHGLSGITGRRDATPEHYVQLAGVLAAFPGAYDSFEEVIGALGAAAEFFTLRPGRNEFEVFRALAALPGTETGIPQASEEYERAEGVVLDPARAAGASTDIALTSANTPKPRLALAALVRQGQQAIAKEDWSGLLETALQIIEAEAETQSDLAGSTHRIELKRLMTRKNLAGIARLAQGERRQETVALLRRFGAESTEILMDLLVEAMSMGERRGYYNALTQMSEGTEAIVKHLGHAQWYVVRNAADLCGEMRLAEAVPELARRIDHPDLRVRKAVAEALGKIATTAAIEPLRVMLADSEPAVRLQVVTHLTGRGARGLVADLGELLRREQSLDVQLEALRALGRIGTAEAVHLLRDAAAPGGKVVNRKPLPYRLGAVRALALIGPPAQDALLALSRDESPELREAAAEVLAGFRP